jgi:hypothetical protein
MKGAQHRGHLTDADLAPMRAIRRTVLAALRRTWCPVLRRELLLLAHRANQAEAALRERGGRS